MGGDEPALCAPRAAAEIRLNIKGSSFISRAGPAGDAAAAQAAIEGVRAAHARATHVVYAFRIGGGRTEQYGMSDAGEPRGTAGRPTLEVLKGTALSNVVLTTVRYFGGTKLGTGGLVRAYSEAARKVLSVVPTRVLVARTLIEFVIRYEYLEPVQRLLSEYDSELTESEYGEEVSLRFLIPETCRTELAERARDVSRGTLQSRALTDRDVF